MMNSFDQLADRHEKLKKRVVDLRAEMESIDQEHSRLEQELARLHGKMETAAEEEVDGLEREIEPLESQVKSLKKRWSLASKEIAELENEGSELLELIQERGKQYKAVLVEGDKLLFEVFKLVATLGTGALVAVSAITAAIVPSPPDNIWILYTSYLLLLLCIFASVPACLITAMRIASRNMPDDPASNNRLVSVQFWIYFYAALGGLTLGIALFIVFLNINTEFILGMINVLGY